ncbi:casein kinase 2 regulatory subunit [Blastocladiella emersonii ATCC 22665]|nr:casein kinase 2 regulatory subunit [Blastocladiella emersonii ATCC 22665]
MDSEMSTSSAADYWVDEFLMKKGNEMFCDVDEDYIIDKFNLTGLASEVEWYQQAMDIILDKIELTDFEQSTRQRLAKNCAHLYGLIHARFIVTQRGLQKMAEKYQRAEFGTCPRTLCHDTPVLPVGLSDLPGNSTVRLYCPRCQDVYNPRSSRHAMLDAAYWGTTFPHLLLQVHPNLLDFHRIPTSGPAARDVEVYTPKIFGFRVHSQAKIARARDAVRDAAAKVNGK